MRGGEEVRGGGGGEGRGRRGGEGDGINNKDRRCLYSDTCSNMSHDFEQDIWSCTACTYGCVSVFNSKWLRSLPAAISNVSGVRSPSASMAFGGSGEGRGGRGGRGGMEST